MYANVRTPGASDLRQIGRVLGGWQSDTGPLHLHPGDLGWYSLRGSAATAAATRVWSDGDTIVAIALLDGPDLLPKTSPGTGGSPTSRGHRCGAISPHLSGCPIRASRLSSLTAPRSGCPCIGRRSKGRLCPTSGFAEWSTDGLWPREHRSSTPAGSCCCATSKTVRSRSLRCGPPAWAAQGSSSRSECIKNTKATGTARS